MDNTLISKRVEEGSLLSPMDPVGAPGVAGPRGTDCGPGILGPTGPVNVAHTKMQEGAVFPDPPQPPLGPTGPTGPMCDIAGSFDHEKGRLRPEFLGQPGANGPIGPTGTPGPIGPTGTPGPTGSTRRF